MGRRFSGQLLFALLLCILLAAKARPADDEAALPAPVLTRVEPTTVPVGGGVRITLFGSNFDTGAPEETPVRVLVAGQPCTKVTVYSDSQATALVPASAGAGAVDVEIRNPDGQNAVLRDALCYDDGTLWLARWYRLREYVGRIWRLLAQGGVTMILLAALSIFGVAWVIHCALSVRPSQIMPKAFLDRLSGHISRGEIQPAMDWCEADGCAFSRVAVAALRKAGESPQKVRQAAEAAGSREASHLLQKISYLSYIGVISPMLGLLGTVLGMIMAFRTFALGEVGSKHVLLAAAIHKAMITTAAGLIVGIPAMACYYFFRGKLLRIVTDMEEVTEDVSEAVAAAGEHE